MLDDINWVKYITARSVKFQDHSFINNLDDNMDLYNRFLLVG